MCEALRNPQHGAMPMAFGKRHFLGAIFPLPQVFGADRAVVLRLGVMVEVNQVFVPDLDCRRPLNPVACEGFARLAVWAFRLIGHRITQVLLQRLLPLVLEDKIELATR